MNSIQSVYSHPDEVGLFYSIRNGVSFYTLDAINLNISSRVLDRKICHRDWNGV